MQVVRAGGVLQFRHRGELVAEHLLKLRLFTEEVAAKTNKKVTMRTSMARFPFVKPLESFEFAYQPSVDREQALATCHFIEHGDNVLVLGPKGWAAKREGGRASLHPAPRIGTQ